MLKLNTPITVGDRTYTHAKLVSASWRANAESLERLRYQLCTVEGGIIRIGSIIYNDLVAAAPPAQPTVTDAPTAFIIDRVQNNEGSADIFSGLHGIDALIDTYLADQPPQIFQDGETTTVLAVTVEPAPAGELPAREIIDNRTED